MLDNIRNDTIQIHNKTTSEQAHQARDQNSAILNSAMTRSDENNSAQIYNRTKRQLKGRFNNLCSVQTLVPRAYSLEVILDSSAGSGIL